MSKLLPLAISFVSVQRIPEEAMQRSLLWLPSLLVEGVVG